MNTIDQIYELYRAEKYDLEKCVAEIAKIIEFQFQVCEKLDCEGRIKAYEFIEKECDDLREKIIRIAGYDPENEFIGYNAEEFFQQQKSRLYELAVEKGLLLVAFDSEAWSLSEDARDHLDYIIGNEQVCYSLNDVLMFLLEEEMREMWEKGQREFYCEMTVITDRLLGLGGIAATKSVESYYERSFLVRAGLLCPIKNARNKQSDEDVSISAFSSYLSVSDKTKVTNYVSGAFRGKDGAKHIAVTLIALNRLGYINLDKENRTALYRSIQSEFGVKFENASINYHINNENTNRTAEIMSCAIKKEVDNINKFLC